MPPRPKKKSQTPYELAQMLYGPDFTVGTSAKYTEAVQQWSELPAAEQSYPTAHLLYLQLMALRRVELLLAKAIEVGSEVAEAMEGLGDAVEEAIAGGDPEEPEEAPPEPTRPRAPRAPARAREEEAEEEEEVEDDDALELPEPT